MRPILTISLLALMGALLGAVAVRDTHAAYCHSKVANGVWEEVQEGVDYAFLLSPDGGGVLHVEEVTADDECFNEWQTKYARASNGNGRRLQTGNIGVHFTACPTTPCTSNPCMPGTFDMEQRECRVGGQKMHTCTAELYGAQTEFNVPPPKTAKEMKVQAFYCRDFQRCDFASCHNNDCGPCICTEDTTCPANDICPCHNGNGYLPRYEELQCAGARIVPKVPDEYDSVTHKVTYAQLPGSGGRLFGC